MLHVAHSVIVVFGTAVVLTLLAPQDRWQVRRLRRRAAQGDLVGAATRRALVELRSDSRRERKAARWAAAAAGACVAASIVHALVGPQHFREGPRFGVFFMLLSGAQLVIAGLLLRRLAPAVLDVAVLLSATTVALWLWTRTAGLPFGLAEKETFGFLDVTASMAEILVVGFALAARGVLLGGRARPRVTVAARSGG